MKKSVIAALVATAAGNAYAIDPFTPLTAPATLSNTNQSSSPFLLPDGWEQSLVTDRATLASQDARFTPVANSGFGNWDMVDTGGATGEYVYIPFEVQTGAGVARYNRDTGIVTPLMAGNNTGVFNSNPATWSATSDDFGAFDPAVTTPTGSLLVAEEWSGNGRMFEVTNPNSATGTIDANAQWLSNIPSVSHEGIKFDNSGSMYFIDEDNSGSIYRFTPNQAGDLTSGSVAVMTVDDFAGNAAATYSNADIRTGAASWVEIVDASGNATTTADPFDFTSRGGRAAADEVDGTPYGRPEDLVIATVNGEEILYWAATSERKVYGMNLATGTVFEAVSIDTPDSTNGTGIGPGSGSTYGLTSPDNLEFTYGPDGELQLFVIEDQNPGDIWMATDSDGDGVMDVIDLFASLGPFGSEPTGFIADPRGGFLVSIQHPADGNDALWRIYEASPVPVPAAAWLFGSGLLGMIGVARRRKSA